MVFPLAVPESASLQGGSHFYGGVRRTLHSARYASKGSTYDAPNGNNTIVPARLLWTSKKELPS